MAEPKIALLIDAENIKVDYMDGIMNEVSNHGRVVVSNLYQEYKKLKPKWRAFVTKYGITPKLHFEVASGKNASDIEMVIDAMKIMKQGIVDRYFIISSDADFTPLAKELKANGMDVFGIGDEGTPKALKNAYSKFISLAVIKSQADEDQSDVTKADLASTYELIKDIILQKGDNNEISLSELGSIINIKEPSFDVRRFGFEKLSNLIDIIDGLKLKTVDGVAFATLSKPADFKEVEAFILDTLKQNGNQFIIPNLKAKIRQQFKGFDHRNYAFSRFGVFLSSIDNVVIEGHFAKLKA